MILFFAHHCTAMHQDSTHYIAHLESRISQLEAELRQLTSENRLNLSESENLEIQKRSQENENNYRNMFENSPKPMWIFDLETYKFLQVNNQAIRHYGYSTEEFLEMTLMDIRPDCDLPRFLDHMSQDVKCRKDPPYWYHQKKNGEIIYVEIHAHEVTFCGKPARLAVVNDITEKINAELEIKKLKKAVESSKISIVLTSPEGVIEYANPFYTQVTGYNKEEYLGLKISILDSDENPRMANRIIRAIQSGAWEGEFLNSKKNGEKYWEYSIISPIRNSANQITHLVAINTDISDKKRMYDELLNAKLKAEESDRLKSAFLMNMSHEIRTPMNGILGFLDLLKSSDLEDESRKEYINLVNMSGERLLNTINDIIEVSKIEAGGLEIRENIIHLEEFNDYYLSFFTMQAVLKHNELCLGRSVTQNGIKSIVTDRHKLDSILTNLVKNAIKFTERGSIEFGNYLEDNFLVFYVKDTGIGIEPDKVEAIFDRFVQADSSHSRNHEGSGLGLSIVKGYTNALGGKIRVFSELRKGSLFEVLIPFKPTENKPQSTILTNLPGIKTFPGKWILVAEDDDISFKLIERCVANTKVNLIRAKTGVEAVELAKNGNISMILMDIKMPEMDGYEATGIIRATNPNLPIIAQTAFSLAGDRERALNAGCNDFISKPIDKKQLLSVMETYL